MRIRTGLPAVAMAAALLLAVPAGAATLYTSSLPGVVIGGVTYDVLFKQLDGGSNTFNDVYGAAIPSFGITTAQGAYDAIEAIIAALATTPVDVTPAPGSNVLGFRVPFAADSDNYYLRVGANFGTWSNTPPSGFNTASRDLDNIFSIAEFTAVAAPAPEPVSFALFGLGLAGLALTRRRSA